MKKYINWLAYISLTIAFIVGYFNYNSNKSEELKHLKFITNNNFSLSNTNSDTYSVKNNDSLVGYLAIGTAQGYGGPLSVAIFSDTSGNIKQCELIHSYESASFLAKIYNKKYYDQYSQSKVDQRFVIDDDIDAVSGATVSSKAIAEAARDASYKIAQNDLNFKTPQIVKPFDFATKEIITLAIFIVGIFAAFLSKRKLRYFSLLLGLIFLGFLFNASLSITHFGRLILGYFPDIHTHFIWWLLIAVTLLIILVWGKNVYCSTLCPFHAAQLLLNKVSGINLKLNTRQAKILSKTPFVLLWLSLMLIFLSSNPTIASYEPFAMLFSLEGVGVQWYILPASLIGALFFSNFFCRFFCPVGATFRWIQNTRRNVLALIAK